MSGFVAYRWPYGEPRADRTAARLREAALDGGWHCIVDQPGWTALTQARPGPFTTGRIIDARTIVLGRMFDRRATEQGGVAEGALPGDVGDFAALCDQLTSACWGGYVALRIDPDDPSRLDIFRDPIGMLDCVTWRSGALLLVSSTPEPFLGQAPPAGLAIDWIGLASLLRFPGAVGEALPCHGVDPVPPGARLTLAGGSQQVTDHWTPASFARRPAPSTPPDLPMLAGACIRAWSSTARVPIAELSGGLDSAIVAESLAGTEPGVAGWFHYYATDREGDERAFARAVATYLGVSLTETLQDHRNIDAALMADVPVPLRPSVASISFFHDRDLAAHGRALGADTLLTGQGGDALFFQPASPLIAADLWHDRRPWPARRAAIIDLADWTGRSVWSVLATALRARLAPRAVNLPEYRVDLVAPGMPRADQPLRWLDDTADLAPAKQLQILNLAAARGAFGGSWCTSAMTVLHPLMSQPLLEHVLPIPALDLTRGKRDRAMIREGYAHRLPQVLLDRRGKGCITPFFGRMLAASVHFLRDYLLGGLLVEQRVLDANRTAMVLDTDYLMQTNSYTEIFVALLIEHWARAWTDRIAAIDRGVG